MRFCRIHFGKQFPVPLEFCKMDSSRGNVNEKRCPSIRVDTASSCTHASSTFIPGNWRHYLFTDFLPLISRSFSVKREREREKKYLALSPLIPVRITVTKPKGKVSMSPNGKITIEISRIIPSFYCALRENDPPPRGDCNSIFSRAGKFR